MNVAIWADNDLDGAGSALAIQHLYKKKTGNFFIREIDDINFIREFKGWIEQNYHKYDVIYILDIHVPDEILLDVDQEKIIIIDHHESHVEVKDRYKKCKAIIEYETSCTILIYNKFKKLFNEVSDKQIIYLFKVIDDYDSYQLKFQETLKLNALFFTYNKPRIQKFIERFACGKIDFTQQETNSILLYCNKFKEMIKQLDFFTGVIGSNTVVSCIANHSINEVASYALKKYNTDICIVVNPDSKTVSFRKSNSCKLDLNKLAKVLCDGGGHSAASGGKVTSKFLTLTKTFNKHAY